jgi:hypothetical protein
MVTVLNNSYPTKMACECALLQRQGIQIHAMPIHRDSNVCTNYAYIKFEIDGESEWLCAECLKHHISNPLSNIFTKAVV